MTSNRNKKPSRH